MRAFSISFLAALAATASTMAAAQPSAAARAGKELAVEVCAYCHVVSADQPVQPTLNQPTRSFEQIANDPASNAKSLKRFISTTHWDGRTYPMTMPNPILLDQDTDQVVSYILSLRKGPPAPEHRAASAYERKLDAGEYIALQLCSYCHVVSSDQRYRPELEKPAPSFAQIAARPDVTTTSLARFIHSAHWDAKTLPMTMPNQSLSDAQTDEVANYILSQRPHP
jgi:mono/diheme cytochrome c family protein